jgi:hypothetical protein
MTVLLLPNLAHADEIVLQALKRHGTGADFSTRSDGPGIPLQELIEDDGSTYSAVPENRQSRSESSVKYEGRLERTWTNKHLRLLADDEGRCEWVPRPTPGSYRLL